MKYVVIKAFADLQDNRYEYKVGDDYPRVGVVVSPKRIAELSTANNKRHVPLIKAVDDESTAEAESPVEEKPVEEKPKRRGRRK